LWAKYSLSDKVPLGAVVFPMTIKGIAQACLGDVFEDNAEVDKLSSCYHSCWREMEASVSTSIYFYKTLEGKGRELALHEGLEGRLDLAIHFCFSRKVYIL